MAKQIYTVIVSVSVDGDDGFGKILFIIKIHEQFSMELHLRSSSPIQNATLPRRSKLLIFRYEKHGQLLTIHVINYLEHGESTVHAAEVLSNP